MNREWKEGYGGAQVERSKSKKLFISSNWLSCAWNNIEEGDVERDMRFFKTRIPG